MKAKGAELQEFLGAGGCRGHTSSDSRILYSLPSVTEHSERARTRNWQRCMLRAAEGRNIERLPAKVSEMHPKTEESVTLPVMERDTSSRADARAGSHLFPAGQLVPFILVTALFFLWGIPNNLNDVLIRQFMKSFSISRLQAGLGPVAFYIWCFFPALPAARVVSEHADNTGCYTGVVCA